MSPMSAECGSPPSNELNSVPGAVISADHKEIIFGSGQRGLDESRDEGIAVHASFSWESRGKVLVKALGGPVEIVSWERVEHAGRTGADNGRKRGTLSESGEEGVGHDGLRRAVNRDDSLDLCA